MEPNYETVQPGSELPSPIGETGGHDLSVQSVSRPEQQTGLVAPATNHVDPQAVQQTVPAPAAPAVVPQQDDSALMADDSDLIEKEWVVRAKSLVNQTKDNPYIQNKEINKVKAEYIKKRYNKDIKVSED